MSLIKQLERIREELKKPLPEPDQSEDEMAAENEETVAPKKKVAAKKSVKKVAKKPAKKASAKVSKGDNGSNQIKLADLAKEADISPQRARQKLREAEVERDGRWSWEQGSRPLAAARKALNL